MPPAKIVAPLLAVPVAGMVCSMTLTEYLNYCCTGQLPASVGRTAAKSPLLDELICLADLLGALEPLCATRPSACDPVLYVEKDIPVPPAVLGPGGVVVPSEARVISYCSPLNRSLVIAESRVTAANQTASEQPITQPIYKRVNLGAFPDGFCLPFEPADMAGQFANVEHVMVPPKAGYSIYVQNFDPTSEAVYHLRSRMWACC